LGLLIAGNLVLSILAMTLIALAFAAAASRLAERGGSWTLGPVWLLGSVGVAGIAVSRVARLHTAAGQTDPYGVPFPLFWLFLGLWAMGFGAISLYVLRRRRRGLIGFGLGAAVRSVGVFFAGMLVFFLGYAVTDFVRLF
jgi:hypothetical protein